MVTKNRNSGSGGHRPGGGLASNKRKEVAVRYGQRAEEVRHQGVAQIGSSIGNHVTDKRGTVGRGVEKVRGELRPAGGPSGIPLGNQIAGNVGKGAPGAGRNLYGKSGTNQQYGEANPGGPRITEWPDTSK
jgi:hypothetical protein